MSCRSPRSSSRWALLLLATAAMVALAACGEGGPAPAGNTTVQVKCETSSDCDGGQTCDPATKYCVAKDTCTPACTGGQKCVAGKCTLSFPDAGPTDGGASDSTSSGDTTPVEDAPIGTDTATNPQDTTGPAPQGDSCKACTKAGDCGAGYDCVTLINGSFCAKKCADVTECSPGWVCDAVSTDPKNTQKNCVLPSYACDGCAVTPCEDGKKCNFKAIPPTCQEVKAQCATCMQDKDCDNGLKCVKMGAEKVCVPDCSSGQVCPENSSCQAFVTGKACAFTADKCCFGPGCKAASACSACSTDKCVGGQCVECTQDSHCTGGKCNLTAHTCITDAACPPADAPEKKIKLASTGECVECTNDTHCAASKNGPKCNGVKHICEKASQTNECSVCTGDYPGCVEINGNWTCVECVTDDDCAKKSAGTCSGKTYTCSGTVGGGNLVSKCDPAKGIPCCKADGDCQNGPSTTFDLACDTKSGLCYDKKGGCDNVSAFCNSAAGSTCKQLTDMLPGGLPGGGGGIPGLPGGGGGTPGGLPGGGVCTCGGSGGGGSGISQQCQQLAPLAPQVKNCDCAKDPNSKDCEVMNLLDPANPIKCCGGGGTSQPKDPITCFLTAGQGAPSDACYGAKCSMLLSCISGSDQGTCGDGLFPTP